MPDQPPIEFTDREKFIVSYYRSAELSRSRRFALYDVATGVASLACIVLFLVNDEAADGFVGYALIAGRLFYLVVEGGRWNADFHSIFTKYDARIKELSDARKREDADR